MSTAYILGVIVGVAAVAIGCLIIVKVKGSLWKGYYDERQELIRGRGYKYACFTLLILMGIDMLVESMGIIDTLPVTGESILFAIIMIGILVYAVYSIMNDAYLGIGQNGKSYTALIIFVIAINLFSAVMTIWREDAFEGGKFSTGVFMQIMCVIAFATILVALKIRKGQVQKQEELEDAMERAELGAGEIATEPKEAGDEES